LRSVQMQTFGDFECIVVDDGSRDGAVLEKAVRSMNDGRFRYHRQENAGAASARNTGIDLAQGEYIAFLDSDDLYLPVKLASDIDAIKAIDDPTCVIFSQVLVERGVGKYRVAPKNAPLPSERIGDYLICRLGFTQTSTLVVERSLAKRSRFTPGLPMAQDFDFPIRLEANGARFYMKSTPSVIWTDIDNPDRVSNMPPFEPMLKWSDDVRPLVGDKAYYAFRGSQISRLAAPRDFGLAARLLLEGLLNFSMPPKLAAKAVIQVMFPRRLYRAMLDFTTAISGRDKGSI
jgi:glycosyltransferase involved in cell wall biosynthesis